VNRLRHFLRHHALRFLNLSHQTSTGMKIAIQNESEWRLYNDIFIDGDYDEPILGLLSLKQNDPVTVLDLGSNVGFFIQRVIHLALANSSTNRFSVLGVEASQPLCDESKKRLNSSILSKEQFDITIHRGLIGQLGGHGVFFHFKDHGLSSIFRNKGKAETIPFINLLSVIPSWKKIDLLKCDIEGSEMIFLENYPSILGITRSAVFEFHTEFCDYPSCIKILKAHGFVNNNVIRKSPHSILEFFWK
jgi:hypothetical protein